MSRPPAPLMKFRGRISRTYNRARWAPATQRLFGLRWAIRKTTGPRSERCAYMLPMYQMFLAFSAGRGDGYRAGDTSRRPWRFGR